MHITNNNGHEWDVKGGRKWYNFVWVNSVALLFLHSRMVQWRFNCFNWKGEIQNRIEISFLYLLGDTFQKGITNIFVENYKSI